MSGKLLLLTVIDSINGKLLLLTVNNYYKRQMIFINRPLQR